jgi:alpha,alpha-trehalose-phosphate synthase [UDP-forming]
MKKGRLIIVSNRLPVSVVRQGESVRLEPSPGGLASALSSLWNSHNNGLWFGSVGDEPDVDVEKLLAKRSKNEPYDLQAITLTPQEVEKFYSGFANEIIWPLFHDLQSRCNFNPEYWDVYQSVNKRFADSLDDTARPEDFIWVHDYHFMLVATYLRQAGIRSKLGFFQHIPFPPADVFEKLPWREAILRGLLDFDVVGFQTERDCANFIGAVRKLFPDAIFEPESSNGHMFIRLAGRKVTAGSFPISIDFEEFANAATAPEVATRAQAIRDELMQNILVLGVDRMDYTKGIPERLQSFRLLLERHPELCRQITLVQVVVPSRSDIPEYKDLRQEVELLVSQINGQFTQPGWVPINYMYRSVPRNELLAYYRAADIALITPLQDGMNLVAKEFCAAQIDERGVLILSEFAGASAEMSHGALIVNPNDFVGVAQAIHQATQMLPEEKRSRVRLLREIVKNHNVKRWAERFLEALTPPQATPISGGPKKGSGGGETMVAKREAPGIALLCSDLTSSKKSELLMRYAGLR